ncbi:HEAT repeat domain-containing protein [Myxococcota bacterium]|nr:HEAT repeat domain-containing protein [Myxococcota bacterium]
MWHHAERRSADLKGPKGFALPGATRHYPPDRPADVERIAIELWIDAAARRIRGTVTLEGRALVDTARLELDARELELERVTDRDGTALAFEHDDGRVAITLPRALAAGEPFGLLITYSGEPRRGLYFIGPSAFDHDRPFEVWTQGQDEDARHWFPCFDFPNQKAKTELVAHVAPGQLALSNGVLVEKRELTDEHVWHYRQDVPHTTYLVTLVVGDYVAIEHAGAHVPVVSYVHPRHVDAGRRTFARTAEMVELFAEKIGIPYPYPRYAQICVADFIFGGMENTSATTLTEQILFDEPSDVDYRAIAESLVAHELAHQWWGDLVTCADWSHAWLNEGFATYFETVWREHVDGAAEAAYARLLDQEAYFSEAYRRPLVERTYEEPIDLFDRHHYEKGSAVLHLVRFALGDRDFWRVLRHYGERHRAQVVESGDLRRAIFDVTGKSFEAFFEQWVFAPGHPHVVVSGTWDADEKVFNLVVEQTQRGDRVPEAFTFPVDVEVVTSAGSKVHRVRIEQRKQTLRLASDERPTYVVFDAGGHVPKQVDTRLSSVMLRSLVERSHDVHAVTHAMRALVKRQEPASIRAVATALAKHALAPIRAEAAKALRRTTSKLAVDALAKAAAEDGDPRVRRAALRALGHLREGADALVDLLVDRARVEASDYAAADALRSLGELRGPKARAALDAALGRTGHNHAIRVGALEGLGKLRDPSALEAVMRHATDREHTRVREAAVTVMATLARFLPDHAPLKAEVRDQLVRSLDDPWLRVRMRAAEGLKALADRAAVPELRDQAERELDGRARRAMKLAERDLRETSGSAEELERLRDELKHLEHTQTKLVDRLEKLETKRKPATEAKAASGEAKPKRADDDSGDRDKAEKKRKRKKKRDAR